MTVRLLTWSVVVTAAALATATAARDADDLPAPFVRLRAIDQTIRQDIRYAGPFNFVGRKIPGYERGECILIREAAEALARVQARLVAQGFHLKVYDCYRPVRAVQSFVAWAQSPEPDYMARIFSPAIDKTKQFALGYIAKRSRHSLGTAIDLGLVRAGDRDLPTPKDAGPCDGPFEGRAKESSLDLGTAYDCSSPLAATAARVSPAARRNRDVLVAAMAAEGFRNYRVEWWHFDFTKATVPLAAHDFPVR